MNSINLAKSPPVPASKAQGLGLPSTLLPFKNVGWSIMHWPWERRRLRRALESANRTLETLS